MIYETPATDARLTAQANREAFEDYNAEDIERMDFATYARLTGRKPGIQAVAAQPGTDTA